MILGQVGKDAHGKTDARHALEHQRVGGDLHHDVGAPGVAHLAEELLQLEALRRGALRGQLLRPDHVAVGADQTHLRAERGLQDVLDEVSGGGLAVGAGDADHGHLPRRVAEEVASGDGQSIAGILHQNIGDLPLGRALAQHHSRALFRSGGDKVMSVADRAHNGDEEIAAAGAAGIIADAGDLHGGIGVHLNNRNVL